MTVLHRMKDENFIICLLFVLLLDTGYSLYINQESAKKTVNETFIVICKDEAGQEVKWTGPKGDLGKKTRPKVEITSYGTSILFNGTVEEDSGTYQCKSPTEMKEFHLKVMEDHSYNKPTNDRTDTINHHNHHHNHNKNNNNNNINKYKYFNKKNKYDTFTLPPDSEEEAPMQFMDTKAEQVGKEGNDVTLRCEVKGGKVKWTSVEGNELLDPRFKEIGDGLFIKNVNRTDSRGYMCTALQLDTGVVKKKEVKLIVQHKPSLPSYPVYAKQEQAWGYLDGIVNLTCEVEAEPPPRFEWKNSNKFKPYGRILNVSSHISILQLKVMTKEAFRNYQCIASNPLGKLEKHFTLDQGTKPSPPDEIELRGENSNMLDLGIRGPEPTEQEMKDNMQPKWYRVEYRVARSDGSDEEGWSNQDYNITEENSYVLSGLQHDTEYEVRAASRNLAGLSDFTNSTMFSTLTSTADGVLLVLQPSNVIISLLTILFSYNYLNYW